MRREIALGLLQGPAEMAPVSSSAHVALLSGWARGGGSTSSSQSFEVALHGGSALALALALRRPLQQTCARSCADAGAGAGRMRLATLALSLLPPAAAGGLLERAIERRLSGPRSIATGLAVGAIAMALADRRLRARTLEQARPADGLALGLAQAVALVPGVSRRGATLAAARLRGFDRGEADALSWLAALPVIACACALKAARLARGPRLAHPRRPSALAGAGAAFVSTLAAVRLPLRRRLAEAPLAPFCAYRIALALLLLAREQGRRRAAVAAEVQTRWDRPKLDCKSG
jgi:undecaprenyl-diphosphatase